MSLSLSRYFSSTWCILWSSLTSTEAKVCRVIMLFFSGAQSPASLHHFNHLQNCTILITCKFAPFLSKSSFATQCNFRTLHSTWLQPMFIFTLIGFCYLVCSFDQPGVYTAIQLVGEESDLCLLKTLFSEKAQSQNSRIQPCTPLIAQIVV